jgi:hypothetical protein
MWRAP